MSKQLRRVAIYLTTNGTHDQANQIRDAIGEKLDEEFLEPIISAKMLELGMTSNECIWEVKGERWVEEEKGAK